MQLYAKLRTKFLKGKVCEACKKRMSKDVHHTRGRAGGLLMKVEYWMAVCRKCHDEIHAYKAWARTMGFLAPPGMWGRDG